MHPNIIDITGNIYGYLTVKRYKGKSMWLCYCKCGNKTVVRTNSLKQGLTKSCGCYNIERIKELAPIRSITHGLRKHPLYPIWANMKSRCYNKHNQAYKNYGGRGIKICKKWKENADIFIKWALNNGWEPGLEIDRENNNKNYKPSNCRFVTSLTNNNNKNNNVRYKAWGEYKTAKEWYDDKRCIVRNQLKLNTIYARLFKGWSVKKSITTPRQKSGRK